MSKNDSRLSTTWSNKIKLEISHRFGQTRDTHYYSVKWESLDRSQRDLEDTFRLSSSHWYGAAEVKVQKWPVEKWTRNVEAYVTGDSYAGQYGGVQERYWLSSNGIALFVNKKVPLFVGMNQNGDNLLRFVSQYKKPYVNVNNRATFLEYTIIQSNDVKETHEHVVGVLFPKPVNIPDERMFTHPIWSTWAVYKKNINQESVLKFANKINSHGFNNSQIEIDDDWTPSYGHWDFDHAKFTDPKMMVSKLQTLGFRVTVWVHPFVTPFLSKPFWYLAWQGAFISLGWKPAVGYWWNGLGCSLDMTKASTRNWLLGELENLKVSYKVIYRDPIKSGVNRIIRHR